MEHHKGGIIKLLSFGLVLVFILYLIKFFDITYPISITTTNRSSELAVVGEGKIEVVPDTGYVDVGVTVNKAATVSEAQKTMAKINNEIIRRMKKLGIMKKDIKTSNYSIFPNYIYEGSENRIEGYNGNATISVTVHEIDLVSQVIEEATAAGANQVQGTRFTVDKPEKYREAARTKAIKNAKQQAGKLAKDLGIRLGRVVNIVEAGNSDVYPMPYLAKDALSGYGGGGGPAVEPGSQTITSVVTLYFEKK